MAFDIDTAVALLEQEVRNYQVPVVDLIAAQTRDPFKVLVATILSARTRDEVTAAAARRLFARAATPAALAALDEKTLQKIIYPVGFFRNKARYLAALPGVLEREFQGRVPDTVEALTRLPGVGRKTANLVVAVAFNKPAICVDTHVHRIMNIWGYVHTRTPLQTEMALREKLPRRYWIRINSLLVAFGQGTCRPQRPRCDRCVLAAICPRIGVTPAKATGSGRPADGRLRMVSWNVNGLRAALKKGFLDTLHELDADIFAIQEIKAMPEQLPDEVKHVPGYHVYWNPARRKGYSGTAVFCRQRPLDVVQGLGLEEPDREGRVQLLEYKDFFLVNSYFPNAGPGLKRLEFKLAFDRAMLGLLDRLSAKKSVVLCGDLNVAHREIDLANPAGNENNPGFSAPERAWMDELVGAGYVDTFRCFNQEPEHYTWWSYRFNARARNIGWRIDYFIVDPGSRDRVLAAAIHADVQGSDHCPVSIEFR
ncbi:MAG TPA: exodeoxyribonuclease III [Desulfobulbus sp.]|nr:exodeoxyribonuclease III [Desulfobulbus sp.]